MTILYRSSYTIPLDGDGWNQPKGKTYECRVWLYPEDDGGYSAIVPTLPGVATQGETIDEAIENVREAFKAAVEEYAASHEDIPWRTETSQTKPHGTIEKWILVNV